VALKNDGSLVAWGDNGYGQTTVPVAAQSGVTAIAAGGAHTVALKNDGTVVAWGLNNYGQVTGTKTTGSSPNSATASPVTLEGQVLSGVTAIASGFGHTLALKNDGTVVKWGSDWGQTTVPEGLGGVTAIAAGLSHSVVLLGTAPLLPFLDARAGGNELILSWSTNATGFALQSTLDLTPPATWADVTNAPALLGAQWTVTNIFSGSAQFYRLRKL
jgi:hypothetical protein